MIATVLWMIGGYGLLAIAGIASLGVTSINTMVDAYHLVFVTSGMLAAVLVPYVLAHKAYRHSFIHMNLDVRHRWTRHEVGFVVFALLMAGFWHPLYFLTTDAGHGWHLETTANIITTFVAIMLIGLWEEFFFYRLSVFCIQRISVILGGRCLAGDHVFGVLVPNRLSRLDRAARAVLYDVSGVCLLCDKESICDNYHSYPGRFDRICITAL